MCGRFKLTATPPALADLFDLAELPVVEPRYNVAPSQPVLAVRQDPAGGRTAALLPWGLVPHWSRDTKAFPNARSETVATKPAFRDAFRHRRCLIAADGFYEWQRRGRRKQPYFIRLTDGRPFAFAGLWEPWEGADGQVLETCAILTTAANDRVRPIHDRMPVIVAPADFDQWLDPAGKPGPLQALLRPYPAAAMAAYSVMPFVNNARHEGPQCIEAMA